MLWSEIQISLAAPTRRLDAEYFKPQYLTLDKVLEKKNWTPWGRLRGRFITGPFGSAFNVENFVPNGPCRYVRGKDVKPFFVKDNDNVYIPAEHWAKLQKYSLEPGDLLVSVVGTLGNVSVVPPDVTPAVFSCKSTAYRVRGIDAYYLCAYLNSRIGALYLQRQQRGAVQTGLNLEDLLRIPIPRLGDKQETAIGDLVRKAAHKREEAKQGFSAAASLCEESLGIAPIDLSLETGYASSVSEVHKARRWDSEYFKPKYSRVIQAILRAKKVKVEGLKPIGRCFSFLTNGHTPLRHDLSLGEVPFLTAEHISDFRVDFDSEKRILLSHHDGELSRTALQDGDLLVTIKGKVGNCAVVRNCLDRANINQDVGLFRLRNGYHPYFVAAWFNSLIGKQLVEQRSTGGINPFLGLGNLRRMPFPLLSPKAHNRIGDLVQGAVEQAQDAESETTRLLAAAMLRVETLITEAKSSKS